MAAVLGVLTRCPEGRSRERSPTWFECAILLSHTGEPVYRNGVDVATRLVSMLTAVAIGVVAATGSVIGSSGATDAGSDRCRRSHVGGAIGGIVVSGVGTKVGGAIGSGFRSLFGG